MLVLGRKKTSKWKLIKQMSPEHEVYYSC